MAAVLAALAWDRGLGGFQLVERYPLVPSLGISLSLAVDGWGVAAGAPDRHHHRHRRAGELDGGASGDKEFFVLLLILVAGVFGVFVSQDLFVFFLFYEIAVLPMYLLIGIWGSEPRGAPGRARSGPCGGGSPSAAASTRR